MADTLSTVTAKVRALMNDLDAELYQDSFLVTYVGMAQSQLDQFLRGKGLQLYRKDHVLTVPAGATSLTLSSTPPLPSDFVTAIALHERAAGSTRPEDWIGMTQASDDLPNIVQGTTLGLWIQQGGALRFVGATTAREVQIDYMTVPAEVASPSDALPVADSAEAIALLTAHLVCVAMGETAMAAQFWSGSGSRLGGYLLARDNLYSEALRRLPPVRRKPWYSRRGPTRLPYIT